MRVLTGDIPFTSSYDHVHESAGRALNEFYNTRRRSFPGRRSDRSFVDLDGDVVGDKTEYENDPITRFETPVKSPAAYKEHD